MSYKGEKRGPFWKHMHFSNIPLKLKSENNVPLLTEIATAKVIDDKFMNMMKHSVIFTK